MKPALVITIIVLWIVLYIGLYFLGSWIIDKFRDSFVKRWGVSEQIYYNEQKKDFRFYLTIIFALIMVLALIGMAIK